jgi:DNA-binding phage protein
MDDRRPGKVIYRSATPEERERHRKVREQIAAELPEIKRHGREILAHALQEGLAPHHAIALLKAERIKKGLSLGDIQERTGIERSTLSRLENNVEANPTIGTLERYASALGKRVRVALDDAEAA